LKEALERQSASSQVLQVISSFAGELDPVFSFLSDRRAAEAAEATTTRKTARV
jgi:hypothetical protein